MKTSKYSDGQIIGILKQAEAGTPVPELCREHGMSSATFYKWRAKYGGMDASLMARLKEFEDKNQRLMKSMPNSDSSTKSFMKPCKKVVKPSRLQEVALNAVEQTGASIRLACDAAGISETCYRYSPKLSDNIAQIADWLIRLMHNQKKWGFGLCYLFLRNMKGFD